MLSERSQTQENILFVFIHMKSKKRHNQHMVMEARKYLPVGWEDVGGEMTGRNFLQL